MPGTSTCHVVHREQVGELHLSRENVERLLASGSFFWIDPHRPAEEDFGILRDVFRFHPLAVEDSEHFGQRAKLDDYDDFVFLVVYGAVPDEDRLVEVHCFYSERFLVTVHRDEAPAFTEVRWRYQKRKTRSATRRFCSIGSWTRSWTASSRSWPTSTTGSTSTRIRPSCGRATSSSRRSSP
jgi:Mg2+ and Co2+ transporter CorA